MKSYVDKIEIKSCPKGCLFRNIYFWIIFSYGICPIWRFQGFGFLDYIKVDSCRPHRDRRLSNAGQLLKRTFFRKYFKDHGLKFQMIVLPDGMIGSIFGCLICHNDKEVLNMSRLNRYLLEILQPFRKTLIYHALYCDAISTYQDYC